MWCLKIIPALKPILWFFPKGDKELGLKQLKEVSYNAFYTRTEAMVWLMRIWNSYENKNEQAQQLAEYLHQTYPDNPYFPPLSCADVVFTWYVSTDGKRIKIYTCPD